MNDQTQIAPEWTIQTWFNTPAPLRLSDLRGRVVVLHAFQMLCPGCVMRGLPQAQNIATSFLPEEVAVIGLHTVFEHHAAMTPTSLEAFLHEFRYSFPIGVDEPSDTGPIPQTMQRYAMRGTPTLILIDRRGYIRKHSFGRDDDLQVGADIATLVAEPISP